MKIKGKGLATLGKLGKRRLAAGLALTGMCRLLAALSAESDAANLRDTLRLANGDRLAGRIVSASPQKGVFWQYDSNFSPANFRYSAIQEIDLANFQQPKANNPQPGRSAIRLSNGDELVGRLREVTAGEAIFETPYGEALRFPRNRWQWIIFDNQPEEPLFSGPTSLEGWTRGEVAPAVMQSGHWTYHNQAFYAAKAASIARDLSLPDRSRLQFDLHWKGLLNLAFALHTDYLHPVNLTAKDEEPVFGGFYSLRLSSPFVEVVMVKQKTPLQYLGQMQTRAFSGKRKAHVDIRIDKSAARIVLLVDGELVKQWVDKNGFAGEGSGIRMVHQGQGSIRFSDFRVTTWNGQIEEPPAIRATAKEDLVTLRNGRRRTGKVQSVQNGALMLALTGGEIEIPLQEIQKIEFAGVANQKTTPASKSAVIAKFAERGVVHLELSELQDERLRGISPNFGPVSFPLRAFEKLSFGKP